MVDNAGVVLTVAKGHDFRTVVTGTGFALEYFITVPAQQVFHPDTDVGSGCAVCPQDAHVPVMDGDHVFNGIEGDFPFLLAQAAVLSPPAC